MSGTSRSGTVAIAHCMQQRCMNFNDALACVRRGRASVHPNSGFWRQLRELEAAMRQAGSLPSTQTTSTSTGNSTGSGSAASVPPLATARSAAAAASAPTRGADCVAAPKIDDKTVTQEVGLETGSESHSKPGAGPNKFPKGGDLPSSDKDKVDEDDDDDDDELALSALVVDAAEDERLAALEAEAAANAANAANAASGTEATQAQAPDSEVRHASSSPGGSCSNSCSNSSSSEGNNTENSLGSSSVVLVEPPVADDDATAVAASATGLLDTFAEASTAESPSDASTGVAKEESTGTGASESSEKGSGLSSSEGAATDEWVVVADSD